MDFSFVRGKPDTPKGHALAYFTANDNSGQIFATYIIVLPIAMDVGKYLPPMLAAQMGQITADDFSAFAVPPVPEAIENMAYLENLAEMRGEDLLDCGGVDIAQVTDLMQKVNELTKSYADSYAGSLQHLVTSGPNAPSVQSEYGVEEVLYHLLSERDKLGELSKIVTKIRFAAEREDSTTIEEMARTASVLMKYLPESYAVSELLKTAKNPSQKAADLCRLYLERNYMLIDQDFTSIKAVDEAISELEKEVGP